MYSESDSNYNQLNGTANECHVNEMYWFAYLYMCNVKLGDTHFVSSLVVLCATHILNGWIVNKNLISHLMRCTALYCTASHCNDTITSLLQLFISIYACYH